MRLLTTLLLIATFGLVGCEANKPEAAMAEPAAKEAAAAPGTATATATAQAGAHVHDLACACTLGQACANMIEVDGKYVPLAGETGVAHGAFCGAKGLKAEVPGELKEGKYIATSFKLTAGELGKGH